MSPFSRRLQQSVITSSTSATGYTRPSGAAYVRYEDLYQSGDTINDALNRLSTASIVTFPTGIFEASDFSVGSIYAIHVPPICKGIWGSGPGTLGGDGSDGTYFQIKKNTSTRVRLPQDNSTGNPVAVMFIGSSQSSVSLGQFQVRGTDQSGTTNGEVPFNNLVVYNPSGAVDMTDVYSTGWYGDNGAPPGETFGLSIHNAPDFTVLRYKSDGRRATGGSAMGAVGFTAQNAASGTFTDCEARFCQFSQAVLYQTSGVSTYNCIFGDASGTGTYYTNGAHVTGFNHERTTGSVHHNPVFNVPMAGANSGVHVTFSNDHFSQTFAGGTVTTDNGSLTVINPTYTNIWGDSKFYIQSWSNYGNQGSTQTQVPLVTQADGTTHLPYTWVDTNGVHEHIT